MRRDRQFPGEIEVMVDVPPVRLLFSGPKGWCLEHVCERRYVTVRAAPCIDRQVVSIDPFHIRRSLRCDLCRIEGFIRDGKWIDAGKTPPPLPDL